jgi:MOSC domain-containing protein YiiM
VTILSINVGRPREIESNGRVVVTSIFKDPVAGPVDVRTLNLAGDEQSDLSVHGGVDKAVYAYPSEHYVYWREQFPAVEFAWGAFGENLTTEGLREDAVHIGDAFNIGSAEFVVTQPRVPCYKLGLRFGRGDMVKRFLRAGRSGFYLSVRKEGTIAPGDAVRLLSEDPARVSVADINRLYTAHEAEPGLVRRVVGVAALPAGWRDYFREKFGDAR